MCDTEPTTAALRRRRGATKASNTKLSRLSELETKVSDPTTLDSEFKPQHLMVIDSIPEDDRLDDNLAKEQNEPGEHEMISLYARRN